MARLQDDLNVFTCWLAWMISTADEKAKLKVHISPFLLLPSICAQFEFKITLLWYNFSKLAYLVEILRSYQICMLLINVKQSWYRSPLRHPSYYHWHDLFQVKSVKDEGPWMCSLLQEPLWGHSVHLPTIFLIYIMQAKQICRLEWNPGSRTEPYSYTCSSISACGDISPLICL